MANSVNPDPTAPVGAVCSGSTLFTSIPHLSEMLGNYLQQSTSADNITDAFFSPEKIIKSGGHLLLAGKCLFSCIFVKYSAADPGFLKGGSYV